MFAYGVDGFLVFTNKMIRIGRVKRKVIATESAQKRERYRELTV